jgi:hypothetical protein
MLSHASEFCINISKMSTTYSIDIDILFRSVKCLHKYFITTLNYVYEFSRLDCTVFVLKLPVAQSISLRTFTAVDRVQSEASPRGNYGGPSGHICTVHRPRSLHVSTIGPSLHTH